MQSISGDLQFNEFRFERDGGSSHVPLEEQVDMDASPYQGKNRGIQQPKTFTYDKKVKFIQNKIEKM